MSTNAGLQRLHEAQDGYKLPLQGYLAICAGEQLLIAGFPRGLAIWKKA